MDMGLRGFGISIPRVVPHCAVVLRSFYLRKPRELAQQLSKLKLRWVLGPQDLGSVSLVVTSLAGLGLFAVQHVLQPA